MINIKNVFLNPLNRVVLPGPGQSAHYVCHACGERFTRTVTSFLDFIKICPNCGSLRVSRDWTVVH